MIETMIVFFLFLFINSFVISIFFSGISGLSLCRRILYSLLLALVLSGLLTFSTLAVYFIDTGVNLLIWFMYYLAKQPVVRTP